MVLGSKFYFSFSFVQPLSTEVASPTPAIIVPRQSTCLLFCMMKNRLPFPALCPLTPPILRLDEVRHGLRFLVHGAVVVMVRVRVVRRADVIHLIAAATLRAAAERAVTEHLQNGRHGLANGLSWPHERHRRRNRRRGGTHRHPYRIVRVHGDPAAGDVLLVAAGPDFDRFLQGAWGNGQCQ